MRRATAFYDRGDFLVMRFLPDTAGTWTVDVTGLSEAGALRAQVEVGAPAPGEHGPVVASGTRFEHVDGTAYTPIGTTAYAWIHSGEQTRRQTLRTLEMAGFNKIRMCVFPKHYDYNRAAPESVPFLSAGPGQTQWDWDAFNAEFFDKLEGCVRELGRLGVVADLILFHPYDRWGFSTMSPDVDESYLRHVVRRLSAFPNVFWSLANEYELVTAKRPADWERFGQIVCEEDGAGHPIGVHNITDAFDATVDWVTHVSFQGGGDTVGQKIDELATRFGKPVVIDEYGYEGNLEFGWGNLTAQEELRRFWIGILRGAGMTHGETYYSDDGIWWANGGRLKGEAWKRIAFLRQFVDAAPHGFLTPVRGGDDSSYVAEDGEDYRLIYMGRSQPHRWRLRVPQGRIASIDLIDTWAMTIETVLSEAQGQVEVALPSRPWMAIRVRCS
ncbi:DUF5605 domain-containing protein [Actinomyces faecalis]|uniref:DUF5605 domain-containing protein n=1 Tax=Actinomyces faecalis TaxID=2722820 RepID=UPI001555C349|nr:DUF5605 domain-containing protein [Actinomyces faecalis]